MKGAIEGRHMSHPDFRINGKIFATIQNDPRWGMVALTPDKQQDFVRANPAAFAPEAGAWGRKGCTRVRIEAVSEDQLGEALTLAFKKAVAEKSAAKKAGNSKPRS
jgi:hypothetical protein